MAQGPSLIFDKSLLESLNLDEAVLMDNFYMSTIIAAILRGVPDRSRKDHPQQKTAGTTCRPRSRTGRRKSQSYPNVHHTTILRAELSRQFDLKTVYGRVVIAGGEPVQLGEKKGFIFRQSPEAEALARWARREFLDVERNIAKAWRRSLMQVDFDSMVRTVMGELGHWRKPKTLEDGKQIANTIIDNTDPEWLLRVGRSGGNGLGD